jgi:hypothetical protein
MLLFLGKTHGTILAVLDSTWTLEGYIFDWMSQGTAASVANGSLAIHFDRRNLVH